MADAADLKSADPVVVWVQVPSSAPNENNGNAQIHYRNFLTTMGHSQVERHETLTLVCAGSIPAAPANKYNSKNFIVFGCISDSK